MIAIWGEYSKVAKVAGLIVCLLGQDGHCLVSVCFCFPYCLAQG